MDESRKISVLIPVYGVEPYLRRCLDSVINNTYKNLEIICVNDGSKDNCLSILREYEAKDPRIVVIDKPNGGLPSARNAAIEVATGEYIAHVDSDDWVHHQYFELLMKVCEQDDWRTDIVMCDMTRTQESIGRKDEKDYDASAAAAKFGGWDIIRTYDNFQRYVCGKLYRRTVIGDMRQPEAIKMCEDMIYNAGIMVQYRNLRVAMLPARLYYYYIRGDSMVASYRLSPDEMRQRLDVMERFMSVSLSKEAEALIGISICKWCYEIWLRQRYSSISQEEKVDQFSVHRRVVWRLVCNKQTGFLTKIRYVFVYCFPYLHMLQVSRVDPSIRDWIRKQRTLIKQKKAERS